MSPSLSSGSPQEEEGVTSVGCVEIDVADRDEYDLDDSAVEEKADKGADSNPIEYLVSEVPSSTSSFCGMEGGVFGEARRGWSCSGQISPNGLAVYPLASLARRGSVLGNGSWLCPLLTVPVNRGNASNEMAGPNAGEEFPGRGRWC